MEAAQEDQTASQMIVKGKRTKRQRPQSPIPFRVGPNSSKSDEASSDICTQDMINSDGTTTEEEEDMANCLILLAQGQYRYESKAEVKFNSRKFMETGTASGTGKAGYYVYECKTCSKTFPSFQALGGHRASHKKPKVREDEKQKRQPANFFVSDDEDTPYISSALSLQLNTSRGLFTTNFHSHNLASNKARVHECSICGAEFSSGQALGGHMRRHRGPVVPAGSHTATALSLTPITADRLDHGRKKAVISLPPSPSANTNNNNNNNNAVLSLDLDLNLPAPEDDHKESKFHFASKQPQEQPPPPPAQPQQQQPPPQQLVFSPPALVGCHY